jgi:transcription elongation factor GreA-like protein
MQVLPEGQYIKHTTYGLGIVTEADSERTTIHFQSHGAKKFVTSIMTAEILGETPKKPIKVKRRSKKAVARTKAAVA